MEEKEQKKKNNFLRNSIVVIIVFFVGMAAMYGITYFFPMAVIRDNVITKLEKDITITNEGAGIADAVEKVYDSVVVVNTYVKGEPYASGTGFVFKKEDGKAYILTNNHVINNASEVYVTFTDGNVVKTDIVGSDALSDVAVLSVAEKNVIAVATLGKSESLRLGDTAFAIGAPLDSAYSWSVSRGIISGKDRLIEVDVTEGNTKTPMVVKTIQTDTAINNGNSGGPLANSNGEVIGINSIKLASESIEGMGFAIPIETALEYAETFIRGEKIVRPYLGIGMVDVSKVYYSFDRTYYRLIRDADVTKGVIVSAVEAKSSAALAGLKENDIITKVDGKEVATNAYLRYYLYEHKVGDEMILTIIRNSKEMEIKVKLVEK